MVEGVEFRANVVMLDAVGASVRGSSEASGLLPSRSLVWSGYGTCAGLYFDS